MKEDKNNKPKGSRYFKVTTWSEYSETWGTGVNIVNIVKDSIIVLSLMLFVGSSLYVNTEYERSLITQFGKVKEVTHPGLHFRMPLVTSRYVADTRMQELTVASWIATKGGANSVGFELVVNHKIQPTDDAIIKLYELYGGRFAYEDRFLANAVKSLMKGVVSKHEIASVTDNRAEIKVEILEGSKEIASEYGISVKDLQIVSIEFQGAYVQKLAGVQAARALAAAAKEKEIEAKFIANKAVEQARGEADSKKLRAEAEAYKTKVESIEQAAAITRIGNANATAIKAQNAAARNASGLADLRKAEAMKNWDGSVPQFMSGGQGSSIFPFMNVKDIVK